MILRLTRDKFSAEQYFMLSVLIVNAGNYAFNMIMGRLLGPAAFAEVALLTTLVLVISFIGMTFQLSAAKFGGELGATTQGSLQRFLFNRAVLLGILTGMVLFVATPWLKTTFQTESSVLFYCLAAGIPFYFVMSVNRGNYQGIQQYHTLSISYQAEMWSKLLLSFVLLVILPHSPITAVSLAILASFLFGLMPIESNFKEWFRGIQLPVALGKQIRRFALITLFYELTQIVINNGDVLLVKHLFADLQAGWYASISLIGRVVYFATWMFVMLLLPAVIARKKAGQDTRPILFKNLLYISLMTSGIVLGCFLFPELIVKLMFGEAYMEIAPLLWKYALATAFFALANIFSYYYLSLDNYFPVLLAGIFGILQLLWIGWGSDGLVGVIDKKILSMGVLLCFQLGYFLLKKKN
jgi:O-antigen/teichoic acid export membrane protein